jgi:hypothetical protein
MCSIAADAGEATPSRYVSSRSLQDLLLSHRVLPLNLLLLRPCARLLFGPGAG